MGIFNKLFKKDRGKGQGSSAHGSSAQSSEGQGSVQPGNNGATAAGPDNPGAALFSEEDFAYSQSIYDRTMLGAVEYEIQSVSSSGGQHFGDAIYGKLIEMTGGLLTLNVIMRRGSEALFDRGSELAISYTMHGEPFAVRAKSIRPPIAGIDELDLKARKAIDNAIAQGYFGEAPGRRHWKYIIQVVLCGEPVRYRRRHARIEIDWDVYYKADDGSAADGSGGGNGSGGWDNSTSSGGNGSTGSGGSGGNGSGSSSGWDSSGGNASTGSSGWDSLDSYAAAKTIDISLGGFKCNTGKHIGSGTPLRCVIDVGFGEVSKGRLIGRVIHCYLIANPAETYEMTVRFTEMDDEVRTFLSGWVEGISPAPVNASAKAEVSEDGREASIILNPPKNNGADVTYDELCACLDSLKVTHGIDHDLLKQMSETPHYNYKYIAARCTPPVDGSDAVLTYHVDLNPSFTPRVNEKGVADFKDIGQINKVSKDDVLAERAPPGTGTPGISVTGAVMAPGQGHDKDLPAGIGTAVNEDNTALLAQSDGFVSIVDGKINVLDTYVVEGDVHTETGNISHNGIVIVKGDVRYGFSVTALGDVIINGTVESAVITTGGTLVIRGGCVGEGNSIDASGNTAINFIDGGSFKIGGSLTTSYILNSTVHCGDSVEMVGDGLIRGSHVTAKNAINAKTVGSERSAADHTVIEAGNDPDLVARYGALTVELDDLSRKLEPVKENIRSLMVLKYKDQLPGDKLVTLEQLKATAQEMTEKQNEMAEKQAEMKEVIDSLGYGTISVKDIAHGGLKVIIGTREMTLRESVKSAVFRRSSDGVVVESLE